MQVMPKFVGGMFELGYTSRTKSEFYAVAESFHMKRIAQSSKWLKWRNYGFG